LLITVIKDAATPRPFKAKRVMAYKNAKSLLELERIVESNSLLYVDDLREEHLADGLYISTFTMDDLDVEPERCGLSGSPTKVHKVQAVVLAGGEHEKVEATKSGMSHLVDRLMEDHILGS